MLQSLDQKYFQLKDILQIEIEKKDGCCKLLRMLEMPLVPLLSLMELRGLKISQSVLKEISDNIEIKIVEITKSAHELIGQVFNLASPEQVARILYDQLKLPSSEVDECLPLADEFEEGSLS